MAIMNCPHCGLRVIPMNDNLCPNCRKSFDQPVEGHPETKPPDRPPIKGLLILVAVSLIAQTLLFLMVIFVLVAPKLPSSREIGATGFIVILAFVFSLVMLQLFIMRKRIVRYLFIGAGLLKLINVLFYQTELQERLFHGGLGLFWVLYFAFSSRARKTFIL